MGKFLYFFFEKFFFFFPSLFAVRNLMRLNDFLVHVRQPIDFPNRKCTTMALLINWFY